MNSQTKIVIIGAGTYGSYLLSCFNDLDKEKFAITVIDVGNHTILSEEEIGFKSDSERYKAASNGRFFGLGGTSARWGGQILFLDEFDNPTNDERWARIVKINDKFKSVVKSKLLGKLDSQKNSNTRIKVGYWLSYGSRKLFKKSIIHKQTSVITDKRVTGFNVKEGLITSVSLLDTYTNLHSLCEGDIFYLTLVKLLS